MSGLKKIRVSGVDYDIVDGVSGFATVDYVDEHHDDTKADVGDVPTKVSELTNDSGFIDSSYHDSTKENSSNKVTSISSSSTNTEYPTAKAVYDLFASITDFDGELY